MCNQNCAYAYCTNAFYLKKEKHKYYIVVYVYPTSRQIFKFPIFRIFFSMGKFCMFLKSVPYKSKCIEMPKSLY